MRWVSFLVVLIVAAADRPARACNPAGCLHGIRLGAAPPANFGGFLIDPGYRFEWPLSRDPLITVEDAERSALVATSRARLPSGRTVITFVDPLEPGRAYRVRYEQACGHFESVTMREVDFVAAAPQPLPRTLGALKVLSTWVGKWDADLLENDGADPEQCRQREMIAAVAHVELEVAPEVLPWIDALEIETMTDALVLPDPPPGGLWSASAGPKPFGQNRFGFSRSAAWIPCPPGNREVRTIDVRMRARVRAIGLELETPPLLVTLSCADAPQPDGGVAVPDADPARDSAVTRGDTDRAIGDAGGPPQLAQIQPSCGCAATERDPSAILLALATIALARSRRRSPGRHLTALDLEVVAGRERAPAEQGLVGAV